MALVTTIFRGSMRRALSAAPSLVETVHFAGLAGMGRSTSALRFDQRLGYSDVREASKEQDAGGKAGDRLADVR